MLLITILYKLCNFSALSKIAIKIICKQFVIFKNIITGKSSSLVETDKSTGLLKARSGTSMITSHGQTLPVPTDNFIHPQTGNVLPVQGNVAFDPLTSRLVFVVDYATGNLKLQLQMII